jgi:hypothetical protein
VADDLRPIVAEYGHADWSGTVYPTHATELARQAALDGYDLVVALGGDGTVHEVVNGLMQVPEEKRPILGVVPLGSGNDFAHAVGVPDKADYALAHALKGEPSTIDIGLLTDEQGRREFFDNTLGIGFDAVVTIRSHRLPLLRGFLMYLVAVIQTIILNFDPASLHVETQDLPPDDVQTHPRSDERHARTLRMRPHGKLHPALADLRQAALYSCGRRDLYQLWLQPEKINVRDFTWRLKNRARVSEDLRFKKRNA